MDAKRGYRTTVKSKNKKRTMTKNVPPLTDKKKRGSNKISLVPLLIFSCINICTQVSGQLTPLRVHLIGGELSAGLQI